MLKGSCYNKVFFSNGEIFCTGGPCGLSLRWRLRLNNFAVVRMTICAQCEAMAS